MKERAIENRTKKWKTTLLKEEAVAQQIFYHQEVSFWRSWTIEQGRLLLWRRKTKLLNFKWH
jgi:hypothetical protein